MAFALNDDQHVDCTIGFVDDVGNTVPAPAGATATWSSSDSTVITVAANPSDPTGMTGRVTAIGKLGTATVQLNLDVPGDPKSPYIGVGGEVIVGAGTLSTVDVTFGTPAHN